MNLNDSLISESLPISLTLKWKILRSFFYYTLRLILFEVFQHSSFNLFLMKDLVLISYNSRSKRLKTSIS